MALPVGVPAVPNFFLSRGGPRTGCWADTAVYRYSTNPSCDEPVIDEELRVCAKHYEEIFSVPEEVFSAA